MQEVAPKKMVAHVRSKMKFFQFENIGDIPWCIKISNRKFTLKIAWEMLRQTLGIV